MSETTPPPRPGDWLETIDAGSGPWNMGVLWYNRAAGQIALHVKPEHCNAYGSMHGGAMATFVDGQAAGVVVYHLNDAAGHTPTISLSVDYLAPVPAGSWLVADVTLLRATRTMLFTQAVLTVDAQVVARSNAIYRNVPGKVPQ
ncbi:MAG: PaaI family thioesterase [Pseudomonadota bacterium]